MNRVRSSPPIQAIRIVASPKAGRGQGREQLTLLQNGLRRDGLDVEVVTDLATLRTWVASGLDPQRCGIVAAGGDGTLSLVASLVPAEMPLVPMPLGTENLLARHFGYQADWLRVRETIAANDRFVIDAGRANGKLFLVMVTAGFDAEVVRSLHLRRRGHIRRWSYAGPIWRAMRKYAFPRIEAVSTDLAGQEQLDEGRWMMAFNLPRYAASLGIEPAALADDGALNLIRFRRAGVWAGLSYVGRIFAGWHLEHIDVARRVVVTSKWQAPTRVPFQIDGDYAGRLPVTIETLPGAVTLLRQPAAT